MSELQNFEYIPTPQTSSETEPLIEDDEVFTWALKCQMELIGQRFSSYPEARDAANVYTTELDKLAFEHNVNSKTATLTGEGLVMPSLILDSSLGSVDVSSALIKRTTSEPLPEPSVSGTFFGFTPYGMPLDDEKTAFRAVIGYQVAVITNLNLPNFCGSLVAYGPIESSTCEFLDDRKLKDAAVAIETLTSIDDESTAVIIHKIDELLSSKDCFSQKKLRTMARLIRKYLSEDNQHFEERHKDALLDLVKARLGLYDSEYFMLNTLSSIETTVYQSNYIVGGGGEGRVNIKDVTFAPYYWKNGDDVTVRPDQLALSIIIERTDENNNPKLTNVLIEKIRVLHPISNAYLADE